MSPDQEPIITAIERREKDQWTHQHLTVVRPREIGWVCDLIWIGVRDLTTAVKWEKADADPIP